MFYTEDHVFALVDDAVQLIDYHYSINLDTVTRASKCGGVLEQEPRSAQIDLNLVDKLSTANQTKIFTSASSF